MSSCSTDSTSVEAKNAADSADLVGVNVYAGITKGADTETSDLETSGVVELHIDDSGTLSESLTFTFADSDWSQTDASQIKWGDVVFPANFYSMHDGAAFDALTFDPDKAVYSDYVVSGASSAHKDLVYHASQLESIPVGGMVSAAHKHALSKINLYAATGDNNVYIAHVNLVNIDALGTVTITPLTEDSAATDSDISWALGDANLQRYQYYYVGDAAASALNSSVAGCDPLINELDEAPLMIIPQETTAATSTDIIRDDVATSYVEVIYYMTNDKGNPVVGFSAVKERPDADDFSLADQNKALYVKTGFPLGYEFEPNKEYDITLGIGADGSTGGILIHDYYVDKDGNEVELTSSEDGSKVTPEVPDVDEGDDVLDNVGDLIDITVTASPWIDGNSVAIAN